MANDKFIIYQLLLRVFGNNNNHCVPNGSFSINGSGKFSSISNAVLDKIKKLSVTHIWYTGVIEHATKSDFSNFHITPSNKLFIKGEAGSPYAIKDYYDVNPYLADNIYNRMFEFEQLVERTHNKGLKVIIDFVPNHLARVYDSDSSPFGIEQFGKRDNTGCSFSSDNNFYYLPGSKLDLSQIGDDSSFFEFPAKVTGNDCFSSKPSINDWYETVKLNYGVDYLNGGAKHFDPIPKTWFMMLDILKFWSSKGVDGFRCDMAEMVPVEFWEWAIKEVKKEYDVIFIAEVYNPSLYDSYINTGGFDYLYDKVGLYDKLKLISQGHLPASDITSVWQSLGSLQGKMLNFLENHDEQRVASSFNLGDPFKSIPELVVSLMLNNSPFMLYFGQEVGEKGMLSEGFSGVDGRTSIFDYCSSPSVIRLLRSKLYAKESELYNIYLDLFGIAMREPAIKSGFTYDLEYANFNNQEFNTFDCFCFARKSIIDNSIIICVVDFSQKHSNVKINLPIHFFEFWDLQQKEYNVLNLLTNKKYQTYFGCSTQLSVGLNKYGISIIKLF